MRNAREVKEDKTIIEYSTIVDQYQKMQHICNWNVKKERNRMEKEKY